MQTYKIPRDYRCAAQALADTAAGIGHLSNNALTG
jgi:hypothetical protein